MSKKPTCIYFVCWPDGKLFEGTQTSISESHAVGLAVQTWLRPQFFQKLELGHTYGGGVLYYLWPAMERAGFKLNTIELENIEGIST